MRLLQEEAEMNGVKVAACVLAAAALQGCGLAETTVATGTTGAAAAQQAEQARQQLEQARRDIEAAQQLAAERLEAVEREAP
jgi:hypothetical protein